MPNASLEVKAVLRLAYDAGTPYEGTDKNKNPYRVLSLTGRGRLHIGGESLEVSNFQVSRFEARGGDTVFNHMLTLRRGDRVEVALALEERPYQNGGKRPHWALQAGQVYSVKVLERASEAVEV